MTSSSSNAKRVAGGEHSPKRRKSSARSPSPSAAAAGDSKSKSIISHVNNGHGQTTSSTSSRPCKPIWVQDGCRYEKDNFLLPRYYEDCLEYIMLPKSFIQDRIEKLAVDIQTWYDQEFDPSGSDPPQIHVLCILKGSRHFFTRLLQIWDRKHKSDKAPYVEHYIRLKSYENMSSTNTLQVQADDLSSLKDQHVLIVEDIIDTGHTLKKFTAYLHQHCYAPELFYFLAVVEFVIVTSLLEKRLGAGKPGTAYVGDFVGFSVPDEFIVGFGLDYNEHFRDLDHVCVMNKTGIERYKA
eukprot:g15002.t1